MWRALAPGGSVICFDKARADRLSDADLDALLDTEYSAETKKHMGIEASVRQTRRMNGEREFRRKDWERLAREAGFSTFSHLHLARCQSSRGWMRWIKRWIGRLPLRIQRRLLRYLPAREVNHLESFPVAFVPVLDRFPKEVSYMVMTK